MCVDRNHAYVSHLCLSHWRNCPFGPRLKHRAGHFSELIYFSRLLARVILEMRVLALSA